MNKIKSSPLGREILKFGIFSGIISLLLATLGFGIFEYYKIRYEAREKLNSQMDILVYNLQPAILFKDKEAAENILMSLQEDHAIQRAVLYLRDRSRLAQFIRNDLPADLRVARPITYNNVTIGTLVIELSCLGIWERFRAYGLIAALIFLISIPLLFVISAPIRSQIYLALKKIEHQSSRLRLLADQVVSSEQMERKRIASLIHDHLQQILVAGKLKTSQAIKALEQNDTGRSLNIMKRVDQFVAESIQAAKSLTIELRPPVLYEGGLPAAFEWLAKRFETENGLHITITTKDIPQLPDSIKILLYESVRELLFNIVKYAETDMAELSLFYKDEHITVCVKDRGRGFNTDLVDNSSVDTAFGLFSIRERLKLLNGTMLINSTPGQGTTIEIDIPVKPEKENHPELVELLKSAEGSTKDKRKGNIKILLVDDHKIVREGILNILKENPLFDVVAQAESGKEAVEKAGELHPDIIIMDINLPEMNGIDATRIIKNKHPDIGIIGLSVLDEDNTARAIKEAGAMALMNKAGDPKELIKTILTCVGR